MLLTMEVLGGVTPGEGAGAPRPLSYPSLPSACSPVCFTISFYNELINLSVSLLSVSHPSILSNPRSGWQESIGDNLRLQLASEVEGSLVGLGP